MRWPRAIRSTGSIPRSWEPSRRAALSVRARAAITVTWSSRATRVGRSISSAPSMRCATATGCTTGRRPRGCKTLRPRKTVLTRCAGKINFPGSRSMKESVSGVPSGQNFSFLTRTSGTRPPIMTRILQRADLPTATGPLQTKPPRDQVETSAMFATGPSPAVPAVVTTELSTKTATSASGPKEPSSMARS